MRENGMRSANIGVHASAGGNLPTHLNQIELARRWRLSPRTLEGWRWRGLGPPYLKIVGRVVYRLEDVEAFEAQRARDTKTKMSNIRPHERAPLRTNTRP